MANFAALDPRYPGKGMQPAGRSTQEVWNELQQDAEKVSELAAAIRVGAAMRPADARRPEDDEDGVREGRILFRLHRYRERNRDIVRRKKKAVRDAGGRLAFEACGLDFGEFYGELAEGLECHHRTPLATTGDTSTELTDLALICANCHRVIHLQRPFITVEDLAQLIQAQRSTWAQRIGARSALSS